jgi:uncharacterized protein DUF2334
MDLDARRTALLSAPEHEHDVSVGARLARRLTPRTPSMAEGWLQRVRSKVDPSRFARDSLAPGIAARQALLGEDASGPPRVLLRVDEFPYATSLDDPERYGIVPSTRFHSVFADAGIPYLMAIVPQLVRDPLNPSATGGRPLNPDEVALIKRMGAEGVTFAAHGLTHRTRDPSPRRRSEFVGLTAGQATTLADDSLALLSSAGLEPPAVFVPPFNRFGRDHYDALASRFDVVCGGPESIAFMGAQPTPRCLGDAVYLPCYPPLYGRAGEVLAELKVLAAQTPGTWVPVTLHLSWELDDGLEDMKRLAEWLTPYATSWSEFLRAIAKVWKRFPSAAHDNP